MNESGHDGGEGRAARVRRGYGWLAGTRWMDRLLAVAATVVMARLLTREDLGLVAVAASIVAILEGLSEFDVQRAVIHAGDEDRELFDTAWTLAVLRGLAAATLLLVLAGALAWLDLQRLDPRTPAVVAVLAAVPLVQGLASPRFVRFERDLRYGPLGITVLISKVLAFTLSVWVAWRWRTHWALVVQIGAGVVTTTVLSYLFSPVRPRRSLARAREILHFSGWMTLANAVTTLAMGTDRILVGWLLGLRDAGLYHLTQRIAVLPTAELVSPLQRILFPGLRQIRSGGDRLRQVVAEAIGVLAGLSLPASFGFALVADRAVALVLDEKWLPIVPLLTVLVPFLGVRATLSVVQPAMLALGRTELLFRVSLLYAVVHLPVFVFATWRYGLVGAVWGIVGAGVFYWLLNAWLLMAVIDLQLVQILRPIVRPALGVVAMAAALLALPDGSLVDAGSTTLAFDLALRVGLGALAYGAVTVGLWQLLGRPAGLESRLLSR